MKPHEIVLLQGAQSDLLSIYAVRGERVYLHVDKAFGVLRLFLAFAGGKRPTAK